MCVELGKKKGGVILSLVEQVSEVFGLNLQIIEEIEVRAGLGYIVTADDQKMLLKAVSVDVLDHDSEYRLRSIMKEAQILRQLPEFTNFRYIGSGECNQYFWFLQKWIEGKSVWDYTKDIRLNLDSNRNQRRFVLTLVKMLEKVMQFYNLGYLHGDLQPRHFIVDKFEDYHLIDLETAVNINDPNDSYRGALVHYVSPEVAKGMLARKQSISIDSISEIYSFGAVAFFLYTAELPVDYGGSMTGSGDNSSFEDKLKAVINGQVKSFDRVRATPFPELERILQKCLAKDREQRYQSFEDLYRKLKGIC